MTAPKPQTIVTELLDRVESLLVTDATPTPFEIKKLERDAQKLIAVDPADGYVVLTAIDALQWDAEACIRHGLNAILLKPEVALIENCAISFRYVGEIDKAREIMENAYIRYPANMNVVNELIYWLAASGQLLKAKALHDKHEINSKKFDDDYEKLIEAAYWAEQFGLTDDVMAKQATLAYKVLAANQRRARGFGFNAEQTESNQGMISLYITFRGDLQDEINFESELAPLLADIPEWNPDLFLIEFRSEGD